MTHQKLSELLALGNQKIDRLIDLARREVDPRTRFSLLVAIPRSPLSRFIGIAWNCHACRRFSSRRQSVSTWTSSKSTIPVVRRYCSTHASSIAHGSTPNNRSARSPNGRCDVFCASRICCTCARKHALLHEQLSDLNSRQSHSLIESWTFYRPDCPVTEAVFRSTAPRPVMPVAFGQADGEAVRSSAPGCSSL